MPDGVKRCSKCGEVKSLSAFNKDAKRADGFKYACKSCCAAMLRDWCKRNPDRTRRYRQDYKSRHPEVVREGKRRFKRNNREKLRESKRECDARYRKSHPIEKRERARQYRATNPDKDTAARIRWRQSNRGQLGRAKELIRLAVGISARDVPADLAEAKLAQIRVVRKARRTANLPDDDSAAQ